MALAVAMRPRHWLKNVLVFAAPLAAGLLLEPDVLVPSLVAFVAFCLISSATYLVNDLRDAESDRAHPTKRNRPSAAGDLPSAVAVVAAIVLAAAAFGLAAAINVGLLLVLLTYAVFTLAYTLVLKHEPVFELLLLAMGFLLRAIAGGVASELPISRWFLIVAGFGSLFMAAGKRYSELKRASRDHSAGEPAVPMRRSLAGYTTGYLRFVWAISAAVAITAYCLWAFEVGDASSTAPWAAWSVLPFVAGLLRYAIDVDKGEAEAPEEVVLHDPALILTGAAWLVLFGLGAMGV
ncbi:MAG: decaprenyl-phosphate phosphoribosyltransferase [Actinomycetota bacterium]|nr:decaprenyl-phosphate phosphoribosyltransferase [Actinomycetota bacterium]